MDVKDEVDEIKSLLRWIRRKMLSHETIMEREEISHEITMETREITLEIREITLETREKSLEMLRQKWLLWWRNQRLEMEEIIMEKEQRVMERIMEEQMQRKSHEEIRLSYHW